MRAKYLCDKVDAKAIATAMIRDFDMVVATLPRCCNLATMLQPCHDKWAHIGSCFSVAVESVFPLDLFQKGTLLMLRAKGSTCLTSSVYPEVHMCHNNSQTNK
eukprot:scaffold7103_cov146-Alexandrium_tamarense.AAC.1